jgi:hypothetical protein
MRHFRKVRPMKIALASLLLAAGLVAGTGALAQVPNLEAVRAAAEKGDAQGHAEQRLAWPCWWAAARRATKRPASTG